MKAFVTGGAGFIGSHLVDRLLEDGYEVTAFDNLSEGKLENLAHVKNEKKFRFVNGDLRDEKAVENVVKGNDVIFHMAAHANIRTSLVDHRADLEHNVIGTIHLLDGMVKHKVNDLVFASCYDTVTRALTKEGLKSYDELTVGDEVLTVNPETRIIEWKPVEQVNIFEHDGKMIHFTGRSVDVLVTPNHKMLLKLTTQNSPANRLLFEEASLTARRNTFQFADGTWIGDLGRFAGFPAEFFYLVGLYIGDGYTKKSVQVAKSGLRREEWLSVARDSNGMFTYLIDNPVRFEGDFKRTVLCIPKADKSRPMVESALKKLGMEWSDVGPAEMYLRQNPYIALLQECGSGAKAKHVPKDILACPPQQLRLVLHGLLDSDGSRRRSITTTSWQLVQDIAEIMTKLGGSITFKRYAGGTGTIAGHNVKFGECFRISLKFTPKWAIRTARKVSYVDYHGLVWCPVVKDNHNLLVERNGKFLFSGNSSALYGEATVRPTPEDYMPVQTSLYGASKLACEAYSQGFTQFSNISFWAYRFSNVIGERCRRGVIWDFVKKLRRNPRELEILGDGRQSKEYIYVKDCVDGIITGYEKSKQRVNPFNLAVEENTTPDQIADVVIREMGLSGVKRTHTGGAAGMDRRHTRRAPVDREDQGPGLEASRAERRGDHEDGQVGHLGAEPRRCIEKNDHSRHRRRRLHRGQPDQRAAAPREEGPSCRQPVEGFEQESGRVANRDCLCGPQAI